MSSYPKNFDPAPFLGMLDEPDPGSDDTWSVWCSGGEPRFPKDFALFCWVSFADALSTFVAWNDAEEWPPEYRYSDLAVERFRKELISHFRALSDMEDECWRVSPYRIECHLSSEDRGLDNRKTLVQTLCVYSIKCFDHGISGLLEKNSIKASMSFAYALEAIVVAHDYQGGPKEAQAERRALSRHSRGGAIAKLKMDPKQNEKSFVRGCWQDWQKKPSAYKGKAAFARDMLTKCEHLKSQKKIEDWCRAWERGTLPAE